MSHGSLAHCLLEMRIYLILCTHSLSQDFLLMNLKLLKKVVNRQYYMVGSKSSLPMKYSKLRLSYQKMRCFCSRGIKLHRAEHTVTSK